MWLISFLTYRFDREAADWHDWLTFLLISSFDNKAPHSLKHPNSQVCTISISLSY